LPVPTNRVREFNPFKNFTVWGVTTPGVFIVKVGDRPVGGVCAQTSVLEQHVVVVRRIEIFRPVVRVVRTGRLKCIVKRAVTIGLLTAIELNEQDKERPDIELLFRVKPRGPFRTLERLGSASRLPAQRLFLLKTGRKLELNFFLVVEVLIKFLIDFFLTFLHLFQRRIVRNVGTELARRCG
jgi:hypothetical protein